MRKRKRKFRKNNIYTIFLIIIIASCLLAFIGLNYFNKNNNKLKLIGYNNTSIKIILNNEDLLNYALNNKHDALLENLIVLKDFKFANLDLYKNYLKENKNISYEDLIYLVNNDYYNYSYSDTLMNLINGKYYLKTRLDRYLAYLEKHNNLEIDEIIKRVNSDIDYDFYTNIEDTDLSFGYQLICNKHYYLGNYTPTNLVAINASYGTGYLDANVYEAFKKLSDDARKENLYILSRSPYRSYATQSYLYNNYVKEDGKKEADTYSARPGHSEHQTGFALDVGTKTTSSLGSFGYTKEFTWMQNNAYKYGFILRYPEGEEYITGYVYENWHYRYVGVEAATTIHNENLTYEEYFTYYILKK